VEALDWECGAGDGDGIPAFGVGFDRGFGVPGQVVRGEVFLGVEGLVPGDDLAGVGGHAAHDAHEGGVGGVFGIDAHFAGADVFEEGVVLELVGVLFVAIARAAGGLAVDEEAAAGVEVDGAFEAVEMLADAAGAFAADLASLAEESEAVGVFELDGVVIKDGAIFFGAADLAPSLAGGFDWHLALGDPVGDVEVVAVLFEDVVTAHPGEEVPVADLVVEFGLPGFAGIAGAGGAVPVDAAQDKVANFVLVDAIDDVDVTGVVAALKSDADVEFFLPGFGGGGEDAANA